MLPFIGAGKIASVSLTVVSQIAIDIPINRILLMVSSFQTH